MLAAAISVSLRQARHVRARFECPGTLPLHDPLYQGETHLVFLAILAVARMVIWETCKKGLYDGANFSHHDLILFFRHQLRVKIRCDRKRLDRINTTKGR